MADVFRGHIGPTSVAAKRLRRCPGKHPKTTMVRCDLLLVALLQPTIIVLLRRSDYLEQP